MSAPLNLPAGCTGDCAQGDRDCTCGRATYQAPDSYDDAFWNGAICGGVVGVVGTYLLTLGLQYLAHAMGCTAC